MKRAEDLDRAISLLDMERRMCVAHRETFSCLDDDAASIDDALAVLRAERERRERGEEPKA